MVVTFVWPTDTTVWLLKNYSQRILTYYTRISLFDLTFGRTMDHTESSVASQAYRLDLTGRSSAERSDAGR